MGKWRTIDSAPLREDAEGSVIVAVGSGDGWIVGEAHPRLNDEDEWQWWWAGEAGDYHADPIFPEPSYWQPLPSPPKENRG